jgi:hypothetical protein
MVTVTSAGENLGTGETYPMGSFVDILTFLGKQDLPRFNGGKVSDEVISIV